MITVAYRVELVLKGALAAPIVAPCDAQTQSARQTPLPRGRSLWEQCGGAADFVGPCG